MNKSTNNHNKFNYMKTIRLGSRNGFNNCLERINERCYMLRPDLGGYMRVGFAGAQNKFSFIDMAGGPFLEVGHYCLNGLMLANIKLEKGNVMLYFEPEPS